MNVFTYTRTERDGSQFTDGFSMDHLLRFIEFVPGEVAVLLDDFHEDMIERPFLEKNGKQILKNIKQQVCSEIRLSSEDTIRFFTAVGSTTKRSESKKQYKENHFTIPVAEGSEL